MHVCLHVRARRAHTCVGNRLDRLDRLDGAMKTKEKMASAWLDKTAAWLDRLDGVLISLPFSRFKAERLGGRLGKCPFGRPLDPPSSSRVGAREAICPFTFPKACAITLPGRSAASHWGGPERPEEDR